MRTTLLTLLLASVCVLLQWLMGAYASDLGGDPDEAAHAVTALMVRDYLWEGLGQSPMIFAQRYYEAFPKVALGHYPPGYYVTGAAVLSLWCDPRALIALQAVLALSLGILTRWVVTRWVGADDRVGWVSAVLVIFHTEVVRVGLHVLSDLQLALLVLGAVAAWIAYLKGPGWRLSIAFGCLAAAAILTKGSALGLAGVPVLAVVLAKRWEVLKRPDFWGCALPVVAVAGPWMVYSVGFTEEGFVGETPVAFLAKAVVYYAEAIPRIYGWILVLLMVASLVRLGWEWIRGEKMDALRATLWAGWLSMQGLVMVVPTGFSPRYLLPGLALVVLLAVLELRLLLRGRLSLGMFFLMLLTVTSTWRHRPKVVEGFSAVVAERLDAQGNEGVWLVSSDPRGEGALIAAAAFGASERVSGRLRVLRGSKVVAETDWLGMSYENRFESPAALLAELDRQAVEWVLVDESMLEGYRKPHEQFLKTALESEDSGWQPGVPMPIYREMGQSGVVWSFERRVSKATP